MVLIDQAKSQLWKIVNELAVSKKNGKSIELFVALYEYGNDGLSPQEGYIRKITPFTQDLDKISDELFKLKQMADRSIADRLFRMQSVIFNGIKAMMN